MIVFLLMTGADVGFTTTGTVTTGFTTGSLFLVHATNIVKNKK
jgi:hypothetical protein